MKTWLNPFLQLVLPERCRLCHAHLQVQGEVGLCGSCLSKVEYLGSAVCRRCGCQLSSEAAGGFLCGKCLKRPPPWDQAVSVVRYGPEVRRLLLRLKYQTDTTVLPALKTIVRPALPITDHGWDHVLPVPLHRNRLQHRGMNQALYIARLLFPEQRKAIEPCLLERNRATAPQTGLDGASRRKNLRGAFQLRDKKAVTGARVCLVDDVFTTGSTVWECSRVLRQAGAVEVWVFTLARVVMGG